jgi:hypothetical protein
MRCSQFIGDTFLAIPWASHVLQFYHDNATAGDSVWVYGTEGRVEPTLEGAACRG